LLINLLLGTVVISMTVIVHTLGLVAVANVMNRVAERRPLHGYRRKVTAMVAVMYGLFAVHTVEIWIWAAVYWYVDAIPHFENALYFSAITFSTLGYGDSLLKQDWQLLAGLEGISGFLLIGWSTAYLVAASTRLGPFQAGKHF
tara:strand:- start:53798 stop:54229 length:432 start_codon:yes stop_codon:yes gene_type:complete